MPVESEESDDREWWLACTQNMLWDSWHIQKKKAHHHLVFTDADGAKQLDPIEQIGFKRATKLRIAK